MSMREDAEAIARMLREKDETIERQRVEIDKKNVEIEQLTAKNRWLKDMVRFLTPGMREIV